MASKDDAKKLHGNRAKIDPAKHVESLYQQNRATQSTRKKGETPLTADQDVEYARKFVEENKK